MGTAAGHPAKADQFLRRPAPPPATHRTPPHPRRKPPPIERTEAKADICHAGNRRKVGAGTAAPGGLPTVASRQGTLC